MKFIKLTTANAITYVNMVLVTEMLPQSHGEGTIVYFAAGSGSNQANTVVQESIEEILAMI